MKKQILIVDDEPMVRWTLAEAARSWDYTPVEAGTVAAGLAAFEADRPAVVLLDINLPDGSGLDLLSEIVRRDPQAVAIMITANVLVDDTLAALRRGAYDFIGKPINLDELEVTIRNGLEARTLRHEISQIRRERSRSFGFDQIIGDSTPMREMVALARKVAQSDVSAVLLQGESGTGKDLVAKAIHYGSRRANAPFVAINCAAIPANLLESELFGYEKGAFTDAKARKEGLIEQAAGGTLFLDEIGELDFSLQAKLLRVLEEGTFRRVGGLKDIAFDTRVVAASNRDLRAESEAGRFRLDLFYRLSVIQIDIAPLRERGDDVLLLAEHYIATLGGPTARARTLSPEAAAAFRQYAWPGNVRELRNAIERALILEEGEAITTAYLPAGIAPSQKPARAESVDEIFQLPPGGVALEAVEASLVRQALATCDGNQTRAAEMLGISRDQIRYRIKKSAQDGHAQGHVA